MNQAPEHSVPCPFCKAAAGAPCTTTTHGTLAARTHAGRGQWAQTPQDQSLQALLDDKSGYASPAGPQKRRFGYIRDLVGGILAILQVLFWPVLAGVLITLILIGLSSIFSSNCDGYLDCREYRSGNAMIEDCTCRSG
jgi:hypothetical protein